MKNGVYLKNTRYEPICHWSGQIRFLRLPKDYSLRARDFQEKKKRLQILRQKASERNPDEFRYGMLSSRSRQGKKIADRGNPVLSHEAVKLLKTQDSGYLRTILQNTRRAIQKLEQEFILREGQGSKVLGMSEDSGENEHVVFVGTTEAQSQYVPRLAISQTHQETATNKRLYQDNNKIEASGAGGAPSQNKPKPRRLAKREVEASKHDQLLRKQHKKDQESRRARLAVLKSRERDLSDAETELELQRAKMTNSVGGITKAGVKWRPRERKK